MTKSKKPEELYPCPCCGYATLDEKPPGTFNICPICFWEDDNVQFDDPDYRGGANEVSLKEAKINNSRHQISERGFEKYVREPTSEEIKEREKRLSGSQQINR